MLAVGEARQPRAWHLPAKRSYAPAMDPLHATIEEFAAEGYSTSSAIALDVALVEC